MASDIAELILSKVQAIEKNGWADCIRIVITHNYIDEHAVSKCIKIKHTGCRKDNTWHVCYKCSCFLVERENFAHVVRYMVQNMLLDFLEITEKYHESDAFTADFDWLTASVYHKGHRVASSAHFFAHDFNIGDLSVFDWHKTHPELDRLLRMVISFVMFAFCISEPCKNKQYSPTTIA